MKAKKETKWCASNSLAHEDLGQFEEAHHWNIQAKFYNEKFPLVDATLKHKCGKRIVTLSLLSFSLIFLFGPFPFFYGLFFLLFSSGVSSRLVGESQSPSSFPHLGQCS